MEFDFVKLEEIFNYNDESYSYFAHRLDKEVEKERLEAHIYLTEKYFRRIIEEKKIDAIFERILSYLLLREEHKGFYYKLINNVISFHDFGKINPEYQNQKMRNKKVLMFPTNIEGIKGADHSLFSSAIYIAYFLKKFDITNLKSKDILKQKQAYLLLEIILNFSYLISKHHSDLNDFEVFLENSDLEDILKEITSDSYKNIFNNFIDNKLISAILFNYKKHRSEIINKLDKKESFALFILNRLVFSILVASDYYATSEYMKGIEIKFFGNIEDILEFQKAFEENSITQNIRKNKEILLKKKNYNEFENINEYRSKIFLEAEEILEKNFDKNIFFLEAPTGSGKSNTALNLSFKLLNEERRKIFYVYPFNTLVEQNKDSLEEIFKNEKLLNQIRVVNSITPIDNKKEDEYVEYDKILLDRQFLNYPLIITTHVGIFDTIIGSSKGNVMPFYQLVNSVIILDEIQAYKSEIWTEIMMILEEYAELLNIKIIIMSATLPDLSLLTGNNNVVRLMKDREFYFRAPIFKDRVQLNFDLLNKEIELKDILKHISENSLDNFKILVEFISKKEAKEFYHICIDNSLDREVLILTGEDNKARRKEVISKIKNGENKILLIATQLIEAGVDIDMDIGYKDISAIDNEEQFLGRINRSCKKIGKAYFFNLKEAKEIYKTTISIINKLDLRKLDMRDCLISKNFSNYYKEIMNVVQRKNRSTSDKGIEKFKKNIGNKNFTKIKDSLCLIKIEGRKISYFFNRTLEVDNQKIVGEEVWNEYKEVLQEQDYAKQKVFLSRVREKMNYFIYEIFYNPQKKLLDYNDYIGELFYIEDGEKYFNNGILDIDEKEELFI